MLLPPYRKKHFCLVSHKRDLLKGALHVCFKVDVRMNQFCKNSIPAVFRGQEGLNSNPFQNLHVSLHGDQRTGQERQHCLNASPAGRLLGARQHCWSCSIPSLRQQHTNVFMIPSEERQKTSQITLLVEGDTHSMVSMLFISLTDILAL